MSTVAPAGGCKARRRSRIPPVSAVESVAGHQDATRSACGAACFIRVLSHLI
jgi:hypothetical protein